ILDGGFQITSGDEFIYHEMMAHVPLFAHGSAERVLIIGGGDGGIARELLRHRTVEAVTLVEIDKAVVDLALSQFPQVSAGAFSSERLDLTIADGAAFVAETDERYDVIIVDSPDPVGAGKVLFDRSFYVQCHRILRAGGILITQSGMPFLTPDWFSGHAADLSLVFKHADYYLSTVPSYTGGPMAHGFATDNGSRSAVTTDLLRQRYRDAGAFPLSYWTPEVHGAAFALPPYIERLRKRPDAPLP
ncbi:MAG: polyamine aminopropyltransferase, partial [Pseudomonadota bacterium]